MKDIIGHVYVIIIALLIVFTLYQQKQLIIEKSVREVIIKGYIKKSTDSKLRLKNIQCRCGNYLELSIELNRILNKRGIKKTEKANRLADELKD